MSGTIAGEQDIHQDSGPGLVTYEHLRVVSAAGYGIRCRSWDKAGMAAFNPYILAPSRNGYGAVLHKQVPHPAGIVGKRRANRAEC